MCYMILASNYNIMIFRQGQSTRSHTKSRKNHHNRRAKANATKTYPQRGRTRRRAKSHHQNVVLETKATMTRTWKPSKWRQPSRQNHPNRPAADTKTLLTPAPSTRTTTTTTMSIAGRDPPETVLTRTRANDGSGQSLASTLPALRSSASYCTNYSHRSRSCEALSYPLTMDGSHIWKIAKISIIHVTNLAIVKNHQKSLISV